MIIHARFLFTFKSQFQITISDYGPPLHDILVITFRFSLSNPLILNEDAYCIHTV